MILNKLSTKFRNQRIIRGNFRSSDVPCLTVFLGLYNGEQYFDQLFDQLVNQTDQDFFLVVVDNDSSDETWARMQIFLETFPGRVKVIKNPFNIGGAGSLVLNYDLIETIWWCALHQDDEYEYEYVAVFNKKIQHISEETISISAEMGSISENGLLNAIPPRANWILNGNNPTDLFVANLRTQIVSFPSTAFRTDVFDSIIYPWHNSSFSDSEFTLKMCAKGTFEFLNTRTMNYRENSLSESHSISSRESNFGVGVSLARVFSSSEFRSIAKLVDAIDRDKFLKAVEDSISIRLGITEYSKFIRFLAAENCMIAWDYSEKASIEQVSEYFRNLGTAFTPKLLSRILEFLGTADNSDTHIQDPETSQFLDDFLGSINTNAHQKNIKKSLLRKVYDYLMINLPFKVQKNVGKVALKFKVKVTKNHPWNFKWR